MDSTQQLEPSHELPNMQFLGNQQNRKQKRLVCQGYVNYLSDCCTRPTIHSKHKTTSWNRIRGNMSRAHACSSPKCIKTNKNTERAEPISIGKSHSRIAQDRFSKQFISIIHFRNLEQNLVSGVIKTRLLGVANCVAKQVPLVVTSQY